MTDWRTLEIYSSFVRVTGELEIIRPDRLIDSVNRFGDYLQLRNARSEPLRLQVSEPAPGRYRGSAQVIQSALGIKPYVGFFGALKLKDEVGVEFEVTLPAVGSA